MSDPTFSGSDSTQTRASIPAQYAPFDATRAANAGGSDTSVTQHRKGRPVLVILFVIALLAAGGVTAFHFVDKRKAEQTIATQQADVAAAKAALAAKEADLAKAQADLAKAKSDAEAAAKLAKANEACVKAGAQLVSAGTRADEAATTAAVNAIFQSCIG